ncbi:hypothetical protein ACFYYM_31800 [Streptomyces erythrochromogenes]|uniref:hypothetical protein n=1 Tax=Streptomyces erythrochromogenes TaxID=285574 RepID=UPI0036849DF7
MTAGETRAAWKGAAIVRLGDGTVVDVRAVAYHRNFGLPEWGADLTPREPTTSLSAVDAAGGGVLIAGGVPGAFVVHHFDADREHLSIKGVGDPPQWSPSTSN